MEASSIGDTIPEPGAEPAGLTPGGPGPEAVVGRGHNPWAGLLALIFLALLAALYAGILRDLERRAHGAAPKSPGGKTARGHQHLQSLRCTLARVVFWAHPPGEGAQFLLRRSLAAVAETAKQLVIMSALLWRSVTAKPKSWSVGMPRRTA